MFCCVSHVNVIEPFVVFGISKSKIATLGSETNTLHAVRKFFVITGLTFEHSAFFLE